MIEYVTRLDSETSPHSYLMYRYDDFFNICFKAVDNKIKFRDHKNRIRFKQEVWLYSHFFVYDGMDWHVSVMDSTYDLLSCSYSRNDLILSPEETKMNTVSDTPDIAAIDQRVKEWFSDGGNCLGLVKLTFTDSVFREGFFR